MDTLITKKHGQIAFLPLLIGGLSLLFSLYAFSEFPHRYGDAEKLMLAFGGAILISCSILFFWMGYVVSKTYIAVYEDHIEGVGVGNGGLGGPISFHSSYGKHTVHQEGSSNIIVNINSVKLVVHLSAKDADEVYRNIMQITSE